MAIAPRLAAACVAVAVTAGLLALFLQRSSRTRAPPAIEVTLRFTRSATTVEPLVPPSRSSEVRVAPRRLPSVDAPRTGPPSLAFEAPTAPASVVVAAPPVAEAASEAPLKLDGRTIGRAIAQARASAPLGVSLTDAASPQARLGEGIAQGAKPDCLAPNPAGSLLSIPIMVFMAVADHCK